MIIILEGPDGAGKTTLAREFKRRLGDRMRYIHDHPVTDQFTRNTAMARQAIKNLSRGLVTVFDRHWISENVYGPVFRNHDPATAIWARRVDSLLLRFGATYVLALPPIDRLEEAFEKLKRERPERFNSVREVAVRYHDLWHGSVVRPTDGNYVEQQSALYPWVKTRLDLVTVYDRFNVKGPLIGWVGAYLQRHLGTHRAMRQADPLDPTDQNLTGSLLHCRTLLVGEQVKDPARAANWPFYRACSQSAGYLNHKLHEAKINELDIAMTNALASDETTHHLSKITRWINENRPGQVNVVALGNIAGKVLDRLKVDHARIPHPQWSRRFDYDGLYHRQLEVAIYG